MIFWLQHEYSGRFFSFIEQLTLPFCSTSCKQKNRVICTSGNITDCEIYEQLIQYTQKERDGKFCTFYFQIWISSLWSIIPKNIIFLTEPRRMQFWLNIYNRIRKSRNSAAKKCRGKVEMYNFSPMQQNCEVSFPPIKAESVELLHQATECAHITTQLQ